MGIVDDYISETNKYKLSHGDKTVVLMQCGSFFEIYGLKDKNGNIILTDKGQELQFKMGLQTRTLNKRKVEGEAANVLVDSMLSELEEL